MCECEHVLTCLLSFCLLCSVSWGSGADDVPLCVCQGEAEIFRTWESHAFLPVAELVGTFLKE